MLVIMNPGGHLYFRPSGYVPFDITDIVESWDDGTSPQRGIVVRAIN